MLAHRLWRWANIKPALYQRLLFSMWTLVSMMWCFLCGHSSPWCGFFYVVKRTSSVSEDFTVLSTQSWQYRNRRNPKSGLCPSLIKWLQGFFLVHSTMDFTVHSFEQIGALYICTVWTHFRPGRHSNPKRLWQNEPLLHPRHHVNISLYHTVTVLYYISLYFSHLILLDEKYLYFDMIKRF